MVKPSQAAAITQHDWLQTPLGHHFQQVEQQLYDKLVGDVFGFYALQMGLTPLNLLKNSRIPTLLQADLTAEQLKPSLQCDHQFLPFAENTIDLICLPHVLEFSENPHQTLREVARVLVPEGHVILTGFNPYSAWGVKSALHKRADYPWSGQFFSMTRIKDWLSLLGLELVQAEQQNYVMPMDNPIWFNRLSGIGRIGEKCWPMCGGLYAIVAKKRVVHMHLLKPNWKAEKLKRKLVTNPPKIKPQQNTQQINQQKQGIKQKITQ